MNYEDGTKEKTTEEYWAISLDDFSEEIFQWLGRYQDGGDGHYARYTGTKEECIDKCLTHIKKLLEEEIYESDDYGYDLRDE